MDIMDNLNKPMIDSWQNDLNKILKCKFLDLETKKKCFEILLYLTSNHGNIINWNLVLERFTLFCTDKKVNHRKYFIDIIDSIQDAIDSIDENDFGYKTNLDILLLKISSVIKSFKINFKDDELKEYVSRLMSSKLPYKNYELINLVSDNITKNSKKRDILFNTLLTEEVTGYTNWGRTYESILGVLNNKKVLNLDDEYYEKVIKLAINYVHSLTLDEMFDNKKMSNKKREISIDYLIKLMDKYHEQYSQYRLVADEVAYDMMKKPIFTVLASPSLLRMSNANFKKSLDAVISSKNPNAYAILLTGNLDKEKHNIAKSYIEDGDKKEGYYGIDYDTNKVNVAKTAIGPVMENVSINTFMVILSLMDIDSKDDSYLNGIKEEIKRLVKKKELFSNKEGRLLFVINKVISYQNRANEILAFANNKNSLYYTDSQYEKIIYMIINTPEITGEEYKSFVSVDVSNKVNRVYAIIDLFTNDNVEFIENKEYLFNIAKKDTSFIKEITNEFNRIGQYNQNMKRIFSGVGDDTYKKVAGKARKLSQ